MKKPYCVFTKRAITCGGLLLLLILGSIILRPSPEKPSGELPFPSVSTVVTAPDPQTAPPVSSVAIEAVQSRGTPAAAPAHGGGASALEAFAEWRRRAQADTSIPTPLSGTLLEEGTRLAGERRAAMQQLMRENPRRALEQSLAWHEWAALPLSIQALVEQPFSVTADFEVEMTDQLGESRSEPGLTRHVILRGQRFAASVYGRRQQVMSKRAVPLQGILLGDQVALWESAAQSLGTEDLAATRRRFPDGNARTRSWWSGQPLGVESTTALCGGKIYHFAADEEVQALANALAEAEMGLGPHTVHQALAAATTGDVFLADTFASVVKDISSAWTEGAKKVLCLRYQYTPALGSAYILTQSELFTNLLVSSNAIYEMSYGKTWLVPTMGTNLFVLPGSESDYGSDPLTTLLNEYATNAGYHLEDYDFIVYATPRSISGKAPGRSNTPGPSQRVFGRVIPAIHVHEFGHNYGLGHANFWNEASNAGFVGHPSGDSLIEHLEYGDIFDTMGSDRYSWPDGSITFPNGHFSMHGKAYLNWIEPGEVTNVTVSGQYRVYRFDHPNARSGSHRLALKVTNHDGEELWVGFRRNFTNNDSLSSGAYLIWATSGASHRLLDTTPLSRPNESLGKDREDAALGPLKTYTDPSGSVRITNLGRGGSAPYEYLDLDVDLGAGFPYELQFGVFANPTLSTPGLTGRYVNQSLEGYVIQDDWRDSQTIAGTRSDAYPAFQTEGWGRLDLLGLTHYSGSNFNDFSVQWDGWLSVPRPMRFATISDDGSQMWIDLNHDGVFDTNSVEFINNHWGATQGATCGDSSGTVPPGTYALRIQYYEIGGSDYVLLCGAPASNVWVGSVSGYWGTGANWSAGTVPGDGDDLVFPEGAVRFVTTNNTSSTHRFRSLILSGGGYTLRGNALTLSNGVYATYASGSGTIALDITLGAAQTVQCAASGLNLNFTGDINLGSHTLTTDGEGNVHLGGVVSGTGGLTKNGSGLLYLEGSGFNTYEGITRVNAGWLVLNKSAIPAIPNGELIIGDGVGGADADCVIASRNSQIGTIPITFFSSGLLDFEGNSDTVGTIEFNGGHIATGGEFTTGTLTLGGDVIVNPSARAFIDGQVALSATRTFYVANASGSPDLELRATVIGSGGLIKNWSGSLGLYGANTFAGVVTINDGLLYAYAPTALGTNTAGTVVNSGGVLAIVNGTALAAEPLTLNGDGDGISGALAASGGSNSCAGTVTLASDSVISVRTNSSLNLAGIVAGPGGITMRQTGMLILSGTAGNTFDGEVRVNEGTLELAKSSGVAIPGPGTLTVGDDLGGVGADVVRYRDADQIATAAPIVINSSGLLDLNGFNDLIGPLTFNGGRMDTGDGTATLQGHVNTLGSTNAQARIDGFLSIAGTRNLNVEPSRYSPDLAIWAQIRGNGGLTLNGDGEVGLMASNSFNGLVAVNAGTLDAYHSFALGSISNGTVIADGATLMLGYESRVGNETLTIRGTGSGSGALRSVAGSNAWAGSITLTGDIMIQVQLASDSLRLSGAIGGTGNLTKTGSGTLRFTGDSANTYLGVTRVYAGTLELDKSMLNGAIPSDLEIGDGSGASPDVVRLLNGAEIDNQARVTVASTGLLDLNNQTESIGSLAGSGTVDLGIARLSTGYNDESTLFSGAISGTGGLSKSGSGTFTLTGTNTYTAATLVNEGALLVNGTQLLSPSLVSAPGTLGGSGTVANITNSGTLAPGTGAGILTCSNLAFAGGSAVLAVELNGLTVGTGYDQANVRGTVILSNATLQVSVGCTPAEGDQFRIINNNGTDAVLGTFTGLPQGAVLTANGLQFQVTYTGGTGNDVVLTVTNTALDGTSLTLLTGNGNGVLDVTECNLLNLVVTNRAATIVTGITAVLTSTTPGVWVTQPESPYPNLAVGAVGTNTRPFQLTTLPGFICGTNVELALTVTTSNQGAFTVSLVLPSGAPAYLVRYDNNTPAALFDPGSYDSAIVVSNLTVPLAKVMISLCITHPKVDDLDLYLLAPDGTTIELSADNGGSGDNYGQSCSDNQRTWFDDNAKFSITTQSAPFVGTFRPETPLSALRGQILNGTWRLRVTDDTAGNAGTLNCWSLHLYPATCTGGGGPCAPCPDQVIVGTITPTDPSTTGRLQLNHVASACGSSKACPGMLSDGGIRHCDLYPFLNGASNACITVSLATTNALFSAVYTNWFAGGSDLCANYLADPGEPGPRSCSFNVAAGAAFVVVVSELSPGSSAAGGDYTLSVTGGSCVPRLDIVQASTNRVVLTWPVFASDFHLESTPALASVSNFFTPVLTVPFALNREFTVTNTMTSTNRFYRLHKP